MVVEIRIKCRDRYEPDNWVKSGSKITSKSNLLLIEKIMKKSPIIIYHSYYRGGGGGEIFAFNDYEDFIVHIKKKSSAGDRIIVYDFDKISNDKSEEICGKIPDLDGKIPQGGAY